MPLVNRDVYRLLDLTPGVEMNSLANTVGFRQYTVSINGSGDGGAGSVAYYLDGGANMTGLRNTGNVVPNPDAVEQFRVITNSYAAEFGRFTSEWWTWSRNRAQTPFTAPCSSSCGMTNSTPRPGTP